MDLLHLHLFCFSKVLCCMNPIGTLRWQTSTGGRQNLDKQHKAHGSCKTQEPEDHGRRWDKRPQAEVPSRHGRARVLRLLAQCS